KTGKALPTIGAETYCGYPGWTLRPPRGIAKHQPRAGVACDEIDGLGGKAVIDRHCDESCAHDAVIGGNELGAVGGQNRDAVAACKSARRERASDPAGHAVEIRIGEVSFALAAKINDRELAWVAVAAKKVAQIGEQGHAFGGAVK